MDINEALNKIANSKASKGGNQIRDGRYRFIVERVLLQKGHTGTCVIPELRVVKAEATEQGVEPNPPGTTVSCVWNLSKHPDAAPGNVKSFVLALLGLDEATTPPAVVQERTAQMLSEAQPFRGVEIDCSTIRRINQGRITPANRGQVMTLPTWQHVPGQTEESILRNRAALSSIAPPPASPPASPPPVSAPPAAAPAGGSILGGIFGK